jgi:hypothetical protein
LKMCVGLSGVALERRCKSALSFARTLKFQEIPAKLDVNRGDEGSRRSEVA